MDEARTKRRGRQKGAGYAWPGSEERHVNADFCNGRVRKKYCQYTVIGEI